MNELLAEVISKRRPDLLNLPDTASKVRMTEEQLEELRKVVLDEFLEAGLQDDDKPNKRGLLLDDLIARLGHV
jgi:hypothetical protein